MLYRFKSIYYNSHGNDDKFHPAAWSNSSQMSAFKFWHIFEWIYDIFLEISYINITVRMFHQQKCIQKFKNVYGFYIIMLRNLSDLTWSEPVKIYPKSFFVNVVSWFILSHFLFLTLLLKKSWCVNFAELAISICQHLSYNRPW